MGGILVKYADAARSALECVCSISTYSANRHAEKNNHIYAKRDCIYMVIFYRPCRPSIRHLPAGVRAPYTPQGLLRQVSHDT